MIDPKATTAPHLEPPQSSGLTPTPKVAAAGISGAISVIIIWILYSGFHLIVPPEIASAITTAVSFGAAYLTPHGK